MAKRNRKRKPARRSPFRQAKPIILAVLEGQTEAEYIQTFSKYQKNPRVKVEVVPQAGVPFTVVEKALEKKEEAEDDAKRQKDENLKYDEVWCVFDIDEHPKVPQAIQLAESNNLELAISNPCFELWLWLHFAAQPGQQHRHKLQSNLKRNYLPNYDKHVDFAVMAKGYDNAVSRAERLEQEAEEEGEERRNPTTGVWRLTTSIARSD